MILKPILDIVDFGISLYKKHVQRVNDDKDYETMEELENVIGDGEGVSNKKEGSASQDDLENIMDEEDR